MRQPVASMVALAAAALAEPGLPQPARTRLEQIVQQAEWLSDLIQHSLQTPVPAPRAGQTDLFGVVDEAIAAERVTWPGDIRVLGVTRPVFTAVPAVLVRRMVANLLSNATRAAGPSGAVTIEIGSDQRSAMLAIEDTGPGFGKIEQGLGLGLAAVWRCACAYGGRLDHGCGTNGGARVSLWLPRTTDAAHQARSGSSASYAMLKPLRENLVNKAGNDVFVRRLVIIVGYSAWGNQYLRGVHGFRRVYSPDG
jgi:C4-dicarboxylate-specific signal transduction histidine kinase